MTIPLQLPSVEECAEAIDHWSAQDPRLRLLVARYPERQPALRHYGLMLWEGGDPASASQAFIAALGFDPTNRLVWADLAGATAASDAPLKAAACYEKAIALGDERARTYLGLATQSGAAGGAFDSTRAAYEEAIARDGSLYEAWLGLGLHFYGDRRFLESLAPLTRAIELSPRPAADVLTCLGKAYDAEGRFAEAGDAFRRALAVEPDDPQAKIGLARVQFIADVVEGPVDRALAAETMQRLDAAERGRIVKEAFHIASGYGHREAAIRLGEHLLDRDPSDTMQAYLLTVLRGESWDRAPSGYLVDYFDRFAENFDAKLVDVLRYDAPARLAALVCRDGHEPRRILDIGCGTGLVGPHIAAPGRTLVGVDISRKMTDKARERGLYASLHVMDAIDYLATTEARFDTLIGADMLIYFGGLEDIMRGFARVLAPGGRCAVSIETADTQRYAVLPSGRFAHDLDYVREAAARAGFHERETIATTLRLEANRPVSGALMLLTL